MRVFTKLEQEETHAHFIRWIMDTIMRGRERVPILPTQRRATVMLPYCTSYLYLSGK